jgi:hypothetical protein
VTPCEYCGGAVLLKPMMLGVRTKHEDIEQMEVGVERCVKCGLEPSVLCADCEFRTEPCPACHSQRCRCFGTNGRVHWYAGTPNNRPRYNLDLSVRDYATERAIALNDREWAEKAGQILDADAARRVKDAG